MCQHHIRDRYTRRPSTSGLSCPRVDIINSTAQSSQRQCAINAAPVRHSRSQRLNANQIKLRVPSCSTLSFHVPNCDSQFSSLSFPIIATPDLFQKPNRNTRFINARSTRARCNQHVPNQNARNARCHRSHQVSHASPRPYCGHLSASTQS